MAARNACMRRTMGYADEMVAKMALAVIRIAGQGITPSLQHEGIGSGLLTYPLHKRQSVSPGASAKDLPGLYAGIGQFIRVPFAPDDNDSRAFVVVHRIRGFPGPGIPGDLGMAKTARTQQKTS